MKDNFKILVFLGKSGSGKGTQVELLAQKYNLRIISSGNLLRERKKQDDFVGRRISEIIDKGGLVATPIIFHLWLHELERLREDENASGIIFEGSPRKLYEAYMLNETMEFYQLAGNTMALHLDISDQESLKRLLARGRNDDEEQAIRKRLGWYQKEVMPVIDFYQAEGKLIHIQGEQAIENVHKEILEKVHSFFEK
ncbi:MAG: hypothetical protein A3E07_03170 [Candidatus Wildermuthbacteria bacterium RIFCSPHIGHO2_12_FULL_45_9]|uniref:Adenylate kinase n=1 Tax=Candidatus Wildermuthbacteria bacterium RIFCSPHIGHO2_02_FULL_45_25 TaxID=1802450 RepID=A0A1G2R4W2_9BACT|nr:MAG: hypothetical protein A2748_03075 [Candidatus Wildermuthbacteria bacterium RIFCSPHIGHO2_01_FULL_45_20]OHA67900.1 MAG: hypothetical protein A3C04_04470 [Candidatus Wildermuthbacteria bacterium RIFCSPHIGHO2_02_FULL_45_25]OHA70564.1 MAG: hypothetical protein A3E07_03170 [Candidatus Wildermuthbacteria bacterium RIFCSPHIGHO2_12_FULL_45_9]